MSDKPTRCRHRRLWLIAGGFWAWCYECGAIQPQKRVPDTTNAVTPAGKWTRPTGKGGPNPYKETT